MNRLAFALGMLFGAANMYAYLTFSEGQTFWAGVLSGLVLAGFTITMLGGIVEIWRRGA